MRAIRNKGVNGWMWGSKVTLKKGEYMKTTEEKISCDIHHYKQTLREFYSNAAAILLAAVIGSALVICFDISIDTKVTLVKLLMGCGVVGILAVVVQFVRFASKKR